MAEASELDKANRRLAIRTALKQEYFTKYYNPFRYVHGDPVTDSGIMRFLAARAKQHEYFKISWKTTRYLFFHVALFSSCFYIYHTSRWRVEMQRRNGEVSPRDRADKFMH